MPHVWILKSQFGGYVGRKKSSQSAWIWKRRGLKNFPNGGLTGGSDLQKPISPWRLGTTRFLWSGLTERTHEVRRPVERAAELDRPKKNLSISCARSAKKEVQLAKGPKSVRAHFERGEKAVGGDERGQRKV